MLIEAIEYTNRNLQMLFGGKLPDSVIGDFVQWVALGAPDPREEKAVDTAVMDLESGCRHWAFRPLQPIDPPQVTAASPDEALWTDSPIHRFVPAKLSEMQFRPSQEADRTTLIRRAYFDLIGLPPPDEVEAFVRDSSAAPFCQLVDRLLTTRIQRTVGRLVERLGLAKALEPARGTTQFREDAYRYATREFAATNDYYLTTIRSLLPSCRRSKSFPPGGGPGNVRSDRNQT